MKKSGSRNSFTTKSAPRIPPAKQKGRRFGVAFDVFDDLLAGALFCLSHLPLLSGYDEPEILPYQITLFGPMSVPAGLPADN